MSKATNHSINRLTIAVHKLQTAAERARCSARNREGALADLCTQLAFDADVHQIEKAAQQTELIASALEAHALTIRRAVGALQNAEDTAT